MVHFPDTILTTDDMVLALANLKYQIDEKKLSPDQITALVAKSGLEKEAGLKGFLLSDVSKMNGGYRDAADAFLKKDADFKDSAKWDEVKKLEEQVEKSAPAAKHDAPAGKADDINLHGFSDDAAKLARQGFDMMMRGFDAYPNPNRANAPQHYRAKLIEVESSAKDPNVSFFAGRFIFHLDAGMATNSEAHTGEYIERYKGKAYDDLAEKLKNDAKAKIDAEAAAKKLADDEAKKKIEAEAAGKKLAEEEAKKKLDAETAAKNLAQVKKELEAAAIVAASQKKSLLDEPEKTGEKMEFGKKHEIKSRLKLLSDPNYAKQEIDKLKGYPDGQVVVFDSIPDQGNRNKPDFGDKYVKVGDGKDGVWYKITDEVKGKHDRNALAHTRGDGIASDALIDKMTPKLQTGSDLADTSARDGGSAPTLRDKITMKYGVISKVVIDATTGDLVEFKKEAATQQARIDLENNAKNSVEVKIGGQKMVAEKVAGVQLQDYSPN